MKISEVRELSTKELGERIEAELKNFNQMKINHSISPLDSPANLMKQRKMIARMKTELRQRELKNN